MSNLMVIRILSPAHGTKRVEVKPSENVTDFLAKVQEAFGLTAAGWTVYMDRQKTKAMSTKVKTLTMCNIKHGDMVYLSGDHLESSIDSVNVPSNLRPVGYSHSLSSGSIVVVEDEVDQWLDKQDGKIIRAKNEQLCHHGSQGKCLHCVPLEPYDEEYLKNVDPPIKFLAFHSYIRKLTGGVDKGKFAMLENLSCKIKAGCKEHPPWPGGICTKCQPNAVTLNRQKYRHVDYIQFENEFVVDRFLNYWRTTGNQRMGFMYGRYAPHKDTPLGIKAVVAAIYEPPQNSTKNSLELLADQNEETVNWVARQLGLRRVGWIFTDLLPFDLKNGTVKHFRGNIDTHNLSAEECIMAAHFQNIHPNPCKLSSEGHFGSKFVTVVVTGDATNQIHFEAYQVSNQAMALVRDDCLIPTKDAPELGYVKESTNEQYVPDVFYKHVDGYGNEVTQLARPLPIVYLLVDLPAAFPVEKMFTFCARSAIKPFPSGNRSIIGEIQDINFLYQYMQQFSADSFLEAMTDFHILIFLASYDVVNFKNTLGGLCEAIKKQDKKLAEEWRKHENWATMEVLMKPQIPTPPISQPSLGPSGSRPVLGDNVGAPEWTCEHCTYINHQNTECEMCNLPNK